MILYNQFYTNQNILTIRFPCWQDFISDIFLKIREYMYGKLCQTLIVLTEFRWIYIATAWIWGIVSGLLPLPSGRTPCLESLPSFRLLHGSHSLHWLSKIHMITFCFLYISTPLYYVLESSMAPHYSGNGVQTLHLAF